MSDSTAAEVTSHSGPKTRLSYESALDLVMSLADFERSTHSPGHSSFHLERIGLLMEQFDNCHLDTPTIHVAGTKGKGSTAAMITSILTAQGYKVGLSTSPHLHSAVERIRMGLEPISQDQFAWLVEQIWPKAEWVSRDGGYGGVTTFEMMTAMAFLQFKQAGADFQVMEVGLGGRLDSTNIVNPEVCAITSISLDHVATLGDTVERIALEKAGIIKTGVPVVVAPQSDEAMQVFRRVAGERSAPLVQVDAQISWQKLNSDITGQSFTVKGLRDTYDLRIPLLGDYQLENASTVVATIETLISRGYKVSKDSIVSGMKRVRWPARLEVVSRNGRQVVVDGAHNPYSMGRLVQAVREYFEFDRVILIFGSLGGHSAKGMVTALAELSPQVLAVQSRHPRASPSRIIGEILAENGLPVVFESDHVGEATRRALEIANPDDLILATGSLSVAAEVIEEIKGMTPEIYPTIKRPKLPGARTVV